MLGEKYFLWNSIPNILCVLALVYCLHTRKSIGAVIVAMFVYLSLHGGHAIFAAATGGKIKTLVELHYQTGDLGVKYVAVFFLLYCSVFLFVRMVNPIRELKENISVNRNILFLLGCFLLSVASFLIDSSANNFLQQRVAMKELLFAICMWIGVLIFSILTKQSRNYFFINRKKLFLVLIALGSLIVIIGFYEIVDGIAWAGGYYSYGYSWRSSSTLFNPNIVGLWCGLVGGLIALMFHLRWISHLATLGAMVIIAWAFILCSSRSGLVLMLVNFSVVNAILLWNRKISQQSIFNISWPFLSFISVLALSIYLIGFAAIIDNDSIYSLYANSQRFILIPYDLYWTFVVKIFIPLWSKLKPALTLLDDWIVSNGLTHPDLIQSMDYYFQYLSKNGQDFSNTNGGSKILESMGGRTSLGYSTDNSFLAIYATAGILSLLFWVSLWGALFLKCFKKLTSKPGIISAHTMGGLVFCFTSGFFLRTPQLFPVWIFLSMYLGACLCWWSTDENISDVSIDIPAIRTAA